MKFMLKHSLMMGLGILSLQVMMAVAIPLANNTFLGISQGVGSAPNLTCVAGSCFGMELAPGFVLWTDFGPGTDGGFIVGKVQKCGSQEFGPSSSNTASSQLTNAWLFFGNYGTFCTDPGGDENLFAEASCPGGGCGHTQLKYFYAVWNGNKIPLGSSIWCTLPSCSPDQLAGIFVSDYQVNPLNNTWSLNYGQVVPSGQFLGVRFELVVRGVPLLCSADCPAVAANINLVTSTESVATWIPVIYRIGYPLTCHIVTTPANGIATVASDCSSGSYQSNPGFIGTDSFIYIANDGQYDSTPGTVTAFVTEPPPSDPCLAQYPVSQFTQIGKQGTLSVTFTGNIATYTNKEVKVCPGTSLDYAATSTKGSVICKVKNNLTAGTGTLRIQDNLKCTDKPKGKDKVHFKVKSGVTK